MRKYVIRIEWEGKRGASAFWGLLRTYCENGEWVYFLELIYSGSLRFRSIVYVYVRISPGARSRKVALL